MVEPGERAGSGRVVKQQVQSDEADRHHEQADDLVPLVQPEVARVAHLDPVVEEARRTPAPIDREHDEEAGAREDHAAAQVGDSVADARRARRSPRRPSSACPPWPRGRARRRSCSRIGWCTARAPSHPMRTLVPMSDSDGGDCPPATRSAITRGLRRDGRAPPARRRGRRTAPPTSPVVCVVSWPLPAITTTSPGSRAAERQRDGARAGRARRTSRGGRWRRCHDLRDDRPRVLAPRVVGREDYDDRRAAAATSPMRRPLRCGRGRRRRRTRRTTRCPAATSRAASSTCSRPSGVWA